MFFLHRILFVRVRYDNPRQLNNQVALQAKEICNKISYRVLSPEFETAKVTVP